MTAQPCEGSASPRVHPTLAARFSPSAFDERAAMPAAHVEVLLDAARRAPSAGNSQPWMFIVGLRGDQVHRRVCATLAPSSLRWAASASLLVVNLAHVHVEGTDWEYSEFAGYDLGQAVAHMTIQGLTMGWQCHQFRAFDREAVAAEFGVPAHWEVTSMNAFGVPVSRPRDDLADAALLDDSDNRSARGRRALDEVRWSSSTIWP